MSKVNEDIRDDQKRDAHYINGHWYYFMNGLRSRLKRMYGDELDEFTNGDIYNAFKEMSDTEKLDVPAILWWKTGSGIECNHYRCEIVNQWLTYHPDKIREYMEKYRDLRHGKGYVPQEEPKKPRVGTKAWRDNHDFVDDEDTAGMTRTVPRSPDPEEENISLIRRNKDRDQEMKDASDELLKNDDVAYGIDESADGGYEKWKKFMEANVNKVIRELKDEFLNDLGLEVYVNDGYDFGDLKDKKFVHYVKDNDTIKYRLITIAINYELFYKVFSSNGSLAYPDVMVAQLRVHLGRHIAMGMLEFITRYVNVNFGDPMVDTFFAGANDGSIDINDMLTDFGQYLCPEMTDVWSCPLADVFTKIVEHKKKHKK